MKIGNGGVGEAKRSEGIRAGADLLLSLFFGRYYKQPAATAEAIVEVEGKRVFRTGDIGNLSDDKVAEEETEMRNQISI